MRSGTDQFRMCVPFCGRHLSDVHRQLCATATRRRGSSTGGHREHSAAKSISLTKTFMATRPRASRQSIRRHSQRRSPSFPTTLLSGMHGGGQKNHPDGREKRKEHAEQGRINPRQEVDGSHGQRDACIWESLRAQSARVSMSKHTGHEVSLNPGSQSFLIGLGRSHSMTTMKSARMDTFAASDDSAKRINVQNNADGHTKPLADTTQERRRQHGHTAPALTTTKAMRSQPRTAHDTPKTRGQQATPMQADMPEHASNTRLWTGKRET